MKFISLYSVIVINIEPKCSALHRGNNMYEPPHMGEHNSVAHQK